MLRACLRAVLRARTTRRRRSKLPQVSRTQGTIVLPVWDRLGRRRFCIRFFSNNCSLVVISCLVRRERVGSAASCGFQGRGREKHGGQAAAGGGSCGYTRDNCRRRERARATCRSRARAALLTFACLPSKARYRAARSAAAVRSTRAAFGTYAAGAQRTHNR